MKNKSKFKVLLVDDDPDIREFMSYNLKKEKYIVETAKNGEIALEKANKFMPDLIILDVMMPGMDGIQVCENLRSNEKTKDVLVCFLTARGEDFSQIAGFDAGADDYISKPVKPTIFLKKIEAMLRRADSDSRKKSNKEFVVDEFKIDFESHDVFVNDKKLVFAKKEFSLLKLLVSNPGKVFTREEIYETVWGSEVVVGDRTIDVHIRKLREKLGDKYISTLKGIGYKFNA
jgi:two-component system, OmpR family, alkaline phosphatase synthesis response regulator PhoP